MAFGFITTLLQRSIVAILRGAGKFSYALSQKRRIQLGNLLGIVMRLISPSRRRYAEENLRIAFPNADEAWRQATLKASYKNLGTTVVELLMFPYITPREARSMMELQGTETVEEALKRGSGVLFLSGHFGNWELLGFTLPLYIDISTTLIVARQSSKIAEMYLNWYRLRTGNRTVPVKKSALSIIRCVKNGEAIAMLADQAAPPEEGVFTPFFGREASTYQAPAKIALRYNVAMFTAFSERLDNGTYRATIVPLPHDDLTYSPEGIKELTRRHVEVLEQEIRKRPDLWAWQHNRWKHKS